MQKQKLLKKKIIIGVTGSFGSGKSTVSSMLASCGAFVVDADKISHELIKPGSVVYKKIIKSFGKDILAVGGSIDRKKLAAIVFSKAPLLKKLNSLIHPVIIRRMKQEIKKAKQQIIVLDAPLLIEAGLKKVVDKLVVVKIKKNEQIQRLRNKAGLRRDDILKRIKAQVSLSDKVRLADFVIDNSGSIGKTKKQVKNIWRKLWRN
ncbi:MAG: dephospho-CoA kinase [Candidatus Omnitrophica bacterium]|jgi:dephospho-CoA kinase|nr:dephospho-CoA kinase [Candidatus Omnitrophota bacterium]